MSNCQVEADFLDYRRSSDPAALARVFDAIAGRLLLAASHLCDDPSTAEDLVQTTFVAAMQSASQFTPGRRVLPWFLAILANRAQDEHRRRQRQRRLLQAQSEPGQGSQPAGAVDEINRRETVEAITAALQDIPSHYREVLNLRYVHGLSPTQIAHTLDRPVPTVKSQLQRGGERLRRALPPALATSMAIALTATPGLAGMRSSILEQARISSSPITSTLTLPILMQKKAIIATVATISILALISGAHFAGAFPMDALLSRTAIADMESNQRNTGVNGIEATKEPAPRSPTVERQLAPHDDDTGTLSIQLVWQDDHRPATDIGCRIYSAALSDGRQAGQTVTSDHDGRIHRLPLTPGRYTVFATKDAHRIVTIHPGTHVDSQLEIPTFGTIDGQISTLFGAPLADARIILHDGSQDLRSTLATSDPEGRFTLRLPSAMAVLVADHPDHGRSKVKHVRSLPGQHHRLDFFIARTECKLAGTVLGPGDVPVIGANVHVDLPPVETFGSRLAETRRSRAHHLVTDSAGRFTVDAAPPGTATIEVRGTEIAHRIVSLPTGSKPHVIRVTKAAILEGTVHDAAGNPVPNTPCVMIDPTGEARHAPGAVTDQHGKYRLTGLPSGAILLACKHPKAGRAERTVTTMEGVVQQLDIRLQARSTLSGQIFDPRGEGVANLEIVATARRGPDYKPGRKSRHLARTDASGRFSIDGCDWDAYSIEVYQRVGPGHSVPRATLNTTRPGDPIRIDLSTDTDPTARVRGRLVEPKSELQVQLSSKALGVYHTLRPRRDNTFASGLLPAGKYRVTFSSPYPSEVGIPPREFTLSPGETLNLPPIAVPSMTSLAPEVTAASGPTPPVTMFVRDASGRRPTFHGVWFGQWIESSGTIPTGKIKLEIGSGPANAAQQVEVTIEPGRDNRPEIRLVPAQPVRWRLRLADGVSPAPNGYRFSLRRAGEKPDVWIYTRSLVSNQKALSEGQYVLTLVGQKERAATTHFTITAPSASAGLREIPVTVTAR